MSFYNSIFFLIILKLLLFLEASCWIIHLKSLNTLIRRCQNNSVLKIVSFFNVQLYFLFLTSNFLFLYCLFFIKEKLITGSLAHHLYIPKIVEEFTQTKIKQWLKHGCAFPSSSSSASLQVIKSQLINHPSLVTY